MITPPPTNRSIKKIVPAAAAYISILLVLLSTGSSWLALIATVTYSIWVVVVVVSMCRKHTEKRF